MNLSDYTQQCIEANPELGNIMAKTFSKIGNIPVEFIDMPLFGHGVAGLTIPSRVLLNKPGFNPHSQVGHQFFVILHEMGHFKRWKALKNKSMVDFIMELSLQEFLAVADREENEANSFAFKILDKLANTFPLPELKYLAQTAKSFVDSPQSDSRMYTWVYNAIRTNANKYETPEDCLMALLQNKLNEMKNEETQLRNFIFKTLKELFESPEPAIAPEKEKVKPQIAPNPIPARPEPRRLTKPKIHPGADPLPKATTKKIK